MKLTLTQLRRNRALAWLIDNPVLTRELRRRMRARAFSWSLILYVFALGVVSIIIMFSNYPMAIEVKSTREIFQAVGKIGRILFGGLGVLEAIIALLVAPMLTSGLATAEKEKDTFDFLRVTTLAPATFVTGCLLTTAGFLMLVYCCTLPILGLTFIFGGVSMREILELDVSLFFAAMTISAWGVFNSTNYSRIRAVRGASIGMIVLLFIIGVNVLPRFFFMGFGRSGYDWMALAWTLFALTMITAVFSIAAARRLYEPNNRLFSYRQFLVIFAIVMASLTGLMFYHLAPAWNPRVDPEKTKYLLSLLHFTGAILCLAAVLIFSVGRVERGDEVWRLRMHRPFLQRFDERIPYYALCLGLWLGCSLLTSHLLDPGRVIRPAMLLSVPLMVLSMAVAWSLARFISMMTENRNMGTVGVILILVLVWAALPLLGGALSEFETEFTGISPAVLKGLARAMINLSPFPLIYNYWIVTFRNADEGLTYLLLTIQIAIFLLPSLSARLRRRLEVSYQWSAPGAGAAARPAPKVLAGVE